ncbi:peptidyl-prolyl cis-trans isomerase FKBP8-like [Petromyzon marinus]|uniref:Peptidyl-prolyl cis-trans isomerase FKBP8-like n=1 Tax=Petromyzon marinus TaxID=7757 RepID=A0AAJ7U4H6_PETMA|nr:peptidyl-prolyl cis-trans isomerase FKBP8-like [Petromyzon marinus]
MDTEARGHAERSDVGPCGDPPRCVGLSPPPLQVLALMGRHEEASASLLSALELEPANVVIHSELFKLRRRMSLRARDGKTATGKKPRTLVPWRWLLGALALALGASVVTSIARL